MTIQIKHRYLDRIVWTSSFNGATLKAALEEGASKGADLKGAYLEGAFLKGADLEGANLAPIRDDFFAVLSAAPSEVEGLITALKGGRVNGSTYEGECACLVGTIANIRGCHYKSIPALKPNAARPIERFFLAIQRGDTPATNQFSAIAVKWAEGWRDRMRTAFAPNAQEAE